MVIFKCLLKKLIDSDQNKTLPYTFGYCQQDGAIEMGSVPEPEVHRLLRFGTKLVPKWYQEKKKLVPVPVTTSDKTMHSAHGKNRSQFR